MKLPVILTTLNPHHIMKITATPLQKAIAHWVRHRDGTAAPGEGIGISDCALCQFYYTWPDAIGGDNAGCCTGCPIAIRTGQPHCLGTIHDSLYALYTPGIAVQSPSFRALSGEFVKFLESL